MSNFSKAKHLMLLGAASLAFASPATAQLDSAMSAAKASTAASAASQQTVAKLDDEADQMVREFRAVLQQKDNIALFVDQQDIYLQSQKSEIESLNRQLATVEQIKQGMVPMMLNMTLEIEDSINADVPFNLAERLERVARVKAVLSDPDVSPVEQYRQVLNAYKVEVSYGQGIDSYEGAHPTQPGNIVNFIRFGRVSLVYMTKNEDEIAVYNMDTKSWDPVDNGRALEMRQAIRIAKGEAAPDLAVIPVFIGQ